VTLSIKPSIPQPALRVARQIRRGGKILKQKRKLRTF
jgi:hypothetical protein